MKRTLAVALITLFLTLPARLPAQTNDPAAEGPMPTLASLLPRAAEVAQKEAYYESAFNQHYNYDRKRITAECYTSGTVIRSDVKKNTNRPNPEQAAAPLPVFDPANPPMKTGHDLINVVELTTNVLAHAKLKLLRRELMGGRPTLVVDFSPPDVKVPENGQVDKLINRVTGRGWVDEEDCTLVRLEGNLNEKMSFFAGLGAVLKGSYSFERTRTDEGVWYSREVRWNANVREFIFYRMIDYRELNTNVVRATFSAPKVTTQ